MITTLVCEGVPLIGLTITTTLLIHRQMVEDAEHRLGVEVDGISERIAAVNFANIRAVHALQAQPRTLEYCSDSEAGRTEEQADLRATMQTLADTAESIGDVAVLGPRGIVRASTIPAVEGVDLSFLGYIADAMTGKETISEVFRARPVAGGALMVSYAAPLKDERGGVLCLVVVTARADALEQILAGKQVFARPDRVVDLDLADSHGVLLSHSAPSDGLGRPAGPIPAAELAAMVGERRFLDETEALLTAPIADDLLFKLARAPEIPPDAAAFWGNSASTGEPVLSLARRISNAPWTLVARIPESEVLGSARTLMLREIGAGVVAISLAIGIGLVLVRVHERGFVGILAAADALAAGQLSVRIPDSGKGVTGRLVARFNAMAQALEHKVRHVEAQEAERASALAAANLELKTHQDTVRSLGDELAEKTTETAEMARVTSDLKRCTESMSRASDLKSKFAQSMSQNLKAPLNAIIACSDLLLAPERGPLTEEQREFIDAIGKAGRKDLTLLTNIVDLCELEAGHVKLCPERLEVARLLATARDAVAPLASHKQITITITDTTSRPANADAQRMHQVLVHLLCNALRFSPRRSTVHLSAADDGAVIAVEVADRGPGVPEDMWPRLFQPFEQTESPLDAGEQGPGLGLAVCKRLVEAHGGSIAARPREGGGLILRFTVPAAA